MAKDEANAFAGEALFIVASMINLGKSGITKTSVTEDDLDRSVSLFSRRFSFISQSYGFSCDYYRNFEVFSSMFFFGIGSSFYIYVVVFLLFDARNLFITCFFQCVKTMFRLGLSVKILCEQWPDAEAIFLGKCRESLELMLEAKGDADRHESETAKR